MSIPPMRCKKDGPALADPCKLCTIELRLTLFTVTSACRSCCKYLEAVYERISVTQVRSWVAKEVAFAFYTKQQPFFCRTTIIGRIAVQPYGGPVRSTLPLLATSVISFFERFAA
mmetsp:Transcript_5949/g.10687  ORF Transcript_5949/g.10687 Transcript_5949/m.10687 type:complete len:115 (+) Transcript_5949:154-498(+)